MPKPDLSGFSLEELNRLIDEATKLRDEKVEERRATLMKELRALDAIKESSKPVENTKRTSAKVTHRGPAGEEWTGRGAPPKWGKAYGATTRADFEKFRIAE